MLLSRENLTKHVASKDPARGHLQALCITKDGVVSTDGHRMLVTPLPAEQSEAFPATDGFDAGAALGDGEKLLLPASDAQRIAAQVDAKRPAVPRKRKRSRYRGETTPSPPKPPGQRIAVDVVGARANGHIPIATMSGEMQTNSRVKKVDGEYPDYSKVVPDPKLALFSIGFNADYLAELAKLVTSTKSKGVKLTFFGGRKPLVKLSADELRSALDDANSSPARLSGMNDDGREVWGILMPMRL